MDVSKKLDSYLRSSCSPLAGNEANPDQTLVGVLFVQDRLGACACSDEVFQTIWKIDFE